MPKKRQFKASHVEKRHNLYYAVLYVPKEVRYQIGKVKFYKSTGTGDLKLAEARASLWVVKWKSEIESARIKIPDPIIQSAKELNELRKIKNKIGFVDDVINEEKLRFKRENVERQKIEVFEQVATGKYKHFDELIKPWKKHQLSRGLAEKSVNQMERDLSVFTARFAIAGTINEESVNKWIEDIAKTKLITPSSLNRILSSTRNFVVYLKTIKQLPKSLPNYFVVPDEYKISKNKNSKSVNKVKSWVAFKTEDIVAIHKEAVHKNDMQLANLIYLASYTGARIEEVCSLRVENIDLKRKSISFVDTKTEAGERVIPIHKELLPKIKNLIEISEDGYLISGLTFNKYQDRSNAVGKRFGRLKEKLGYTEQFVFHSIRKTFTTLLEDAGVLENIAADILGHEKPRITYGLYSGGATLQTKLKAIHKIYFKFDDHISSKSVH